MPRYTAFITITWLTYRVTYGSNPADFAQPLEQVRGVKLLNAEGVVFSPKFPKLSTPSCAGQVANANTSAPTELPGRAHSYRKKGSSGTGHGAGDHSSAQSSAKGAQKAKRVAGALNRWCLSPDCGRIARFGFHKQVAVACSLHRLETHVNVLDKCCQHIEGCPKRPAYGLPGDRVPLFCAQHKTGAHIDVRNRLCLHPDGCRLRPSYGSALDRKPVFCVAHKQSWQEDVTRRRCQASLCLKRASYGAPGSADARHCAQHKREGQVDVRHRRRERAHGERKRKAGEGKAGEGPAQAGGPSEAHGQAGGGAH